MVVEPAILQDKPEPFDRVQIRGIRGKIEGFKAMPLQGLLFVPGRIIKDKDIPLSGRDNRCSCLIKEDLEHLRADMGGLYGKELTRSGADQS